MTGLVVGARLRKNGTQLGIVIGRLWFGLFCVIGFYGFKHHGSLM